jgi:DNA-binding beta-propeller fold protein YncE
VPCGTRKTVPYQGCTGVTQAPDGTIYAAAATENILYSFTSTGALIGKLGTGVNLRGPYDVAVDGDRLYVSESGAHRITALDRSGHLLGHFGTPGAEEGQLREPRGIEIANRELFVVDGLNENIEVYKLP